MNATASITQNQNEGGMRELLNMLYAVRRVQDEVGDTSLGTVALLLMVTTEPGLSQTEYADKLRLGKTTLSQQALRLTELDAYHKPGLGLIEQRVDPRERRRKTLHLTKKGSRVMGKILKSMEGWKS